MEISYCMLRLRFLIICLLTSSCPHLTASRILFRLAPLSGPWSSCRPLSSFYAGSRILEIPSSYPQADDDYKYWRQVYAYSLNWRATNVQSHQRYEVHDQDYELTNTKNGRLRPVEIIWLYLEGYTKFNWLLFSLRVGSSIASPTL